MAVPETIRKVHGAPLGGSRSGSAPAIHRRGTGPAGGPPHVLAPMAAAALDAPLTRLERHFRRHVTAGLQREVAELRATGTRVSVLTPDPEDIHVMGAT